MSETKKANVFILAGRTGGPLIPAMAIFEGIKSHIIHDTPENEHNKNIKNQDNKMDFKNIQNKLVPIIIGIKGGFEDNFAISSKIKIEYLPQTKLDILSFKLSSLSFFEILKLFLLSFVSIIKLIYSFLVSFLYLLRYRPVLIIATGSFLGIPVVFSGHILKFFGIISTKVLVHQQDPLPALSNKTIIKLADIKSCVFESTKEFNGFEDCKIIPNPVDPNRFLEKAGVETKVILENTSEIEETNGEITENTKRNTIKQKQNYIWNPSFALILFFSLLANYLQWLTYSPVYIMPIFILIGLSWSFVND